MLVLGYHYRPRARAHVVKIQVLSPDGADGARAPLLPFGRGHLMDGKGSANVVFLDYSVVFQEDAGLHTTVGNACGAD